MSDEVVRGNGVAPGQPTGQPMPSVATDERKSLSDMRRHLAAKNAEAGQPKPDPRRPVAQTRAQPGAQAAPRSAGDRMAQFDAAQQQQRPGGGQKPQGDDEQQARQPGQAAGQAPEPVLDGDDQPPAEVADAPEGEQQAGPGDDLSDADAAARYREMLAGGFAPPELDGLQHEVKVDGRVMYVDSNELRQGYMRGGGARAMVQRAQQAMGQAQQVQQRWQQHFESARDPQYLHDTYEREGYGEVLDQVAHMRLKHWKEQREVVRAAGLAAMQRFGVDSVNDARVQDAMRNAQTSLKRARDAEIQMQRVQWQQQQLQQQQRDAEQKREAEQSHSHWSQQISQLRPLAFRANGIHDNGPNRTRFAEHLVAIVQTQPGRVTNITRDMCLEAAQALADEMAAREGGGQQAGQQVGQRQPARRQPLNPGRLALGAGKPHGQQAERKRGSDFAAEFRRRRLQ